MVTNTTLTRVTSSQTQRPTGTTDWSWRSNHPSVWKFTDDRHVRDRQNDRAYVYFTNKIVVEGESAFSDLKKYEKFESAISSFVHATWILMPIMSESLKLLKMCVIWTLDSELKN